MSIEPTIKRKKQSHRIKVVQGTRDNYTTDQDLLVTEPLRRYIGVYCEGDLERAVKNIEFGNVPNQAVEPLFSLIEKGETFHINGKIYAALIEFYKRNHKKDYLK